jgi:C-5 cytosine-specific DNA methylase
MLTKRIDPARGDSLSVRELARLQGFNDDFVFYGALRTQYLDVLAAQPPALSRAIGEAIRDICMLSRKVKHGGSGQNVGANKRARVEDGDRD